MNKQVKKLKKAAKLWERLRQLEEEMNKNLRQKTSDTAEISISDYQRKIETIRKQIDML